MRRSRQVRASLVGIGAIVVALATIPTVHSQPLPPRPGGPTGIRGGPGFPPSMPSAPGMPGTGIRGGIAGRPPGFPDIPRPPDFPRPPGFGRAPGIGGLPGGPTIYEWSCSRCGQHLGTGANPPLVNRCPRCGAILNGSQIIDGPGAGPRMPDPAPITPPDIPGGGLPAFPNPPLEGPPPIGAGPEVPIAGPGINPTDDGGVYVPASEPAPSRSGRSNTIVAIAITLGVLILLAVGIGAIVFAIVKAQKPVKRSRPRLRSRDDDY